MIFGVLSIMLNESRRGNRKKVLFWKQNKTFLRKVRAPTWSGLLGNSQYGQPWG